MLPSLLTVSQNPDFLKFQRLYVCVCVSVGLSFVLKIQVILQRGRKSNPLCDLPLKTA